MERYNKLANHLRRRCPQLELRVDEPLSRHTSFHIGGPVRLMAFPGSEEEMVQCIRLCREMDARLIVMGGGGGYRGGRDGLQDPRRRAERAGRGNRHRRGGWLMEDRILVDSSMRVVRADVYARGRLLDPKSGRPLPCYDRERYTGGYAAKLPVFVYLFP